MVVIFMNNLYFTAIFGRDFYVLYSTVLHLPCPSDSSVSEGCWDRTHGTVATREKAWVYQSTRPCLAMPCVTQLMTDGCVIYYITAAGKFHQLAAGQLLSAQPVLYGKGRQYGPKITYKITPAGSLSSSQPGGPPCWASPLSFGLIGCDLRLWHWHSDVPTTRQISYQYER